MEFPRQAPDDELNLPLPAHSHRARFSPSLPNIWFPPSLAPPSPRQLNLDDALTNAAARPHLGSLDLASPVLKHAQPQAYTHPAPTPDATPLTPPLTPATTSDASSVKSVRHPPPLDTFRFPSLNHKSNSPSSPSFPAPHNLYSALDTSTHPQQQWSHQPVLIRSHSISSPSKSHAPSRDSSPAKYQNLFSLTDLSHDLTPRPSPADLDAPPNSAGRFLLVRGVPKSASSQALKQGFNGCGDLRGIFIRFQADHGAVILAFFDTRHAVRAWRLMQTQTFFDGQHLDARFVSPEQLKQALPKPEFIAESEAELYVSTQTPVEPSVLQQLLTTIGELHTFTPVIDGNEQGTLRFKVEYFDCRDSSTALLTLNNRTIREARIRIAFTDPLAQAIALGRASRPVATIAPDSSSRSRGSSRRVSTGSSGTPSQVIPPARPTPPQLPLDRELRHAGSDQSLHARLQRSSVESLRSRGSSSHGLRHRNSNNDMAAVTTQMEALRMPTWEENPTDPSGAMLPSPTSQTPSTPTDDYGTYYTHYTWDDPRMRRPPLYMHPGPVPVPVHVPVLLPHHLAPLDTANIPMEYRTAPQSNSTGSPSTALPFSSAPPTPLRSGFDHPRDKDVATERNRLDIDRIERGEDTRTTIMIKNIPNKMSDRNLIEFIHEVTPRRIDFLYLRMDFMNGCNVGYAFVNFITVHDLLTFAKARLGVKWNMFSSEKVLQMTYANYQGKEALVEKFKNSCIMEERESWRPKIFYSSGLQQGQPEPWPAPTHTRRKERTQASAQRVLYAHQRRGGASGNNDHAHRGRAAAAQPVYAAQY